MEKLGLSFVREYHCSRRAYQDINEGMRYFPKLGGGEKGKNWQKLAKKPKKLSKMSLGTNFNKQKNQMYFQTGTAEFGFRGITGFVY
jgi:hypothetical protein